MSDTSDDLIQSYIKSPKLLGVVKDPTFVSVGKNRLCGDLVSISVLLNGDSLKDIRFETTGCVLAKAASALTTELCIHKNILEVLALSDEEILVALGIEINLRKQCALLPLFTVKEGLRIFLSSGATRSEHLLAG